MIRSMYFPQSDTLPAHLGKLIEVFKEFEHIIDSKTKTLKSDEVLKVLEDSLMNLNYQVEMSKKKKDKLIFSILHGENGHILKSFSPDAYNEKSRTILEIEAGRAVDNNEYLKDLFKAFLLPNIEYLALAIRNDYRKHDDFQTVKVFFQSIYVNRRISIPLKGILLIGY